MSDVPYSLEFIERLLAKALALSWEERTGPDGEPHMQLHMADNPDQSAGYVRLWAAVDSSLDRMVHMRLQAGPVETQLLFLFGRAGTTRDPKEDIYGAGMNSPLPLRHVIVGILRASIAVFWTSAICLRNLSCEPPQKKMRTPATNERVSTSSPSSRARSAVSPISRSQFTPRYGANSRANS